MMDNNKNIEKYKSSESFKVPEGYFDELQENVLNKVDANPSVFSWRMTLGIAASILVLICFAFIVFQYSLHDETQLDTDKYAGNYEAIDIDEMTTDEYADIFTEIELDYELINE